MNSEKPNKNSLNLLVYFGKREFSLGFFVLYLLMTVIVALGVNFILDGWQMSSTRVWYVISIGLLMGTALYFWDLNKARKE